MKKHWYLIFRQRRDRESCEVAGRSDWRGPLRDQTRRALYARRSGLDQ